MVFDLGRAWTAEVFGKLLPYLIWKYKRGIAANRVVNGENAVEWFALLRTASSLTGVLIGASQVFWRP